MRAALAARAGGRDVEVCVWDKGRGPGGRMSTSRARGDGTRRADLGAQYLTMHGDGNKAWYSELEEAGVIVPLSGDIEGQRADQAEHRSFVAPAGMGAVVKHLAKDAGVVSGARVSSLDADGGRWLVGVEGRSEREAFDCVVLTVPTPQVLALAGGVAGVLSASGASAALAGVEFSARYALALWWEPSDTAALLDAVPWTGRYVGRGDSDSLRYLSFEPRKRRAVDATGRGLLPGSDPPAMVAHTSVSFGAEHLEEGFDDVTPGLLAEVRRLVPGLPDPAEVRCHRWRYSQVTRGAGAAAAAAGVAVAGPGGDDQSSDAAWLIPGCPPLVVAGDAMAESNLDGTIRSGETAARKALEALLRA